MQVGVAEQWSGGQKVRGSGVVSLEVVSGQRSSKVWKTHTLFDLIKQNKKKRRGNGVIKTDTFAAVQTRP